MIIFKNVNQMILNKDFKLLINNIYIDSVKELPNEVKKNGYFNNSIIQTDFQNNILYQYNILDEINNLETFKLLHNHGYSSNI